MEDIKEDNDNLLRVENATIPFSEAFYNVNGNKNVNNFTSPYMKDLVIRSDLQILQPAKVLEAFKVGKAGGLFHLFFTKKYLDVISQWTNTRTTAYSNMQVSGYLIPKYPQHLINSGSTNPKLKNEIHSYHLLPHWQDILVIHL